MVATRHIRLRTRGPGFLLSCDKEKRFLGRPYSCPRSLGRRAPLARPPSPQPLRRHRFDRGADAWVALQESLKIAGVEDQKIGIGDGVDMRLPRVSGQERQLAE